MMKRLLPWLPVLLIFFAAEVRAEVRAEEARREVRLVLFDSEGDWSSRARAIEGAGGTIRAGFPGGGAIVDAPAGYWLASNKRDDGSRSHTGYVAHSQTADRSAARHAIQAWNRYLAEGPGRVEGEIVLDGEHAGPVPDAAVSQSKTPTGSNANDTSEFLLGSVTIAILLPESDGGIDPSSEDWAPWMVDSVVARVQQGASWWQNQPLGGEVSFVFHTEPVIPTPYEPITRNAFTTASLETLWTAGLFDTLGYSTGNAFQSGRDYLNDLRTTYDTDWAVAVIVANSKNDADGRFATFNYGFSYYGGPYLVMTWDNGNIGPAGMKAVMAHEFAHTWYALDEYNGGGSSCGALAGYEQYENQNSLHGGPCATDDECIMRSSLTNAYNTNAACAYSLGQVGMGDNDMDLIGNVLDTEPSSLLDPIADTIGTYTPTFTGSSFVNPLTNLNTRGEGNDITLNTIQTVEYRIDGGAWTATTPVDGLFDGPGEAFTFTTGSLTETTHIVETRATNSVANAELVFPADTFYVPDAIAPAPVTAVTSAATDSVVTLIWTNPSDADFMHTVIRFSTVSAPATLLDGTELTTRATAPAASDTFAHTGLLPDVVYYYSFFTADEVPNYGTVVSVIGAPLYPPPPALLSPAPDSLYVKTDAIFTWDPVTLPDLSDTLIAYGLQVATDAGFAALVFDGDATVGAPADTFWSATGLADGGNYWWRMRGKDLLTNTYGYWSEARAFSTELPIGTVAFLDSTQSDYTTFQTGEVVPPLQDARIEARVSPSDTLGIGGHFVQVHWTNGPIADSLALTLDRAESDFSYWRGDVPFGVAFEIGDTVSFWVSAKDPHGTPVTDKNGGQNFQFIAARNPVAAYHVPSSAEPGALTMRSPFYVTDTDPSFTVSVGASPAGSMSAGEVLFQVLNDTLFAAAPLVFATTVGDTDYYEATIDSSFAFNTDLVYYARVWGDSTRDTTFVHSDFAGSAVTLDPATALLNAFPLLIQSATGVDGADDPIPAIPVANELGRNEPNPFNPTTAIRFALSSPGVVRMRVFDVSGRLVRTLIDETMPAGNHVARWNGLSETGSESASGVYLYRIEMAGWSETRRMILIR